MNTKTQPNYIMQDFPRSAHKTRSIYRVSTENKRKIERNYPSFNSPFFELIKTCKQLP